MKARTCSIQVKLEDEEPPGDDAIFGAAKAHELGRNWMRPAFGLLTVLMLLIVLPSGAKACSCAWWTPNAIRANSAVVAEVEVLATSEAGTNSVAKLKTLTVFKGQLGAEQDVRYWAGIGPACQIDLKVGETLVVFGPTPPELTLNMCSVIRRPWGDYEERTRRFGLGYDEMRLARRH